VERIIYLDNSATTKQYPEVNNIMFKTMESCYGNPSSLHSLGMAAEKAVREARNHVAKALGADPAQIYFTSCGTEADNTAILGAARARKRRGNRIITTKVEHPAVLESCKQLEKEGFEVIYLDVNKEGFVEMENLKAALTQDTILVSMMAVNNESGAIMPVAAVSEAISAFNKENKTDILFHSDMVQSFGKVKLNINLFDMVSISAHKIHGPKGIGALYVKKGLTIDSLLIGGGQEKHFRSGTENVPAIVGFGEAARLCNENFDKRIKAMSEAKEALEMAIRDNIKDIKINSPSHDVVPSVLNVSFMGTRGEVILHTLEQKGVYVSTGSACSSNNKNKKGSHVLKAMGLSDKEVEGAIRFSFCEFNTVEEMQIAADAVIAAVASFRRLGSFR